jgi:hypothetical protein
MSGPRTAIRFLALCLGTSVSSASAQRADASSADSSLRGALARIGADSEQTVRVAGHETGRLEGDRVSVFGDSVFLSTRQGLRSIAVASVDSLWIQHGSAAPLLGLIAAVPCAVYGGLVGAFIGGDPDSQGSPRRATIGLLAGMIGGGAVCGSVGAAIGSAFPRWRLEYSRVAEPGP